MKLIISGSTGFIGSHVLQLALSHPSITSILLLSRRSIPSTPPKVKVLILQDFSNYDGEALQEIKDADAACWCLGTSTADVEANLTYPVAFVEAMARVVRDGGNRFRYVHLSGAFVEREQGRRLWFLSGARKVRGRAESQVLDFASKPENGKWESIVFRPGGVYYGFSAMTVASKLAGSNMSVHADELAAAMLDAAVNGYDGKNEKGEKVIVNADIVKKGRELLAKPK